MKARGGRRAGLSVVAAAVAAAALLLAAPARGQTPDAATAASRALAHELLGALVAIPSVSGSPHTVAAAETLAARLLAAGFPAADVQIVGPAPGIGNLVARFRGADPDARPILLMAHIDVVDARPEDWSFPPFAMTEEDGWWYGRGTTDNKAGATILIANAIRLRQEGFVPDRDLVVVLTGDEETSSESIRWLIGEHDDLGTAAFALNTDAGGGTLRDGREATFEVQASEKVYLSFRLEVRNAGGHSSRPSPDNAIYHLAAGLSRLAALRFPVALNEVTRAYFTRAAEAETGALAADLRAVAAAHPHSLADSAAAERLSASPFFNAMLRTTCVATRLAAGHADNALPQTAAATVNCRILPGESPDDVERALNAALADARIAVSRIAEPTLSPPSPLTPEILGAIQAVAAEMFPGVPVVPTMSTGATDGLYVRNAGIPTYGVGAIFEDPEDDRAHGKDERIAIDRFDQALAFWYRLVKELTEP